MTIKLRVFYLELIQMQLVLIIISIIIIKLCNIND
jgi:hypothetical protein